MIIEDSVQKDEPMQGLKYMEEWDHFHVPKPLLCSNHLKSFSVTLVSSPVCSEALRNELFHHLHSIRHNNSQNTCIFNFTDMKQVREEMGINRICSQDSHYKVH